LRYLSELAELSYILVRFVILTLVICVERLIVSSDGAKKTAVSLSSSLSLPLPETKFRDLPAARDTQMREPAAIEQWCAGFGAIQEKYSMLRKNIEIRWDENAGLPAGCDELPVITRKSAPSVRLPRLRDW
jgi:hypothetical protein